MISLDLESLSAQPDPLALPPLLALAPFWEPPRLFLTLTVLGSVFPLVFSSFPGGENSFVLTKAPRNSFVLAAFHLKIPLCWAPIGARPDPIP